MSPAHNHPLPPTFRATTETHYYSMISAKTIVLFLLLAMLVATSGESLGHLRAGKAAAHKRTDKAYKSSKSYKTLKTKFHKFLETIKKQKLKYDDFNFNPESEGWVAGMDDTPHMG